MADTHEINLTLDPISGNLKDPIKTEVDKNDRVVWRKTHRRLEWFRIEAKFPERYNPFKDYNTNPRSRLTLRVKEDAQYHYNYEWEYFIHYKLDTEDTPRTLDPKIAVKPKRHITLSVLLSLAVAAITIITIRYVSKLKKN